MTIEERIARSSIEDRIEIGQIVERLIDGEKGKVLKCVIEGIKDEYLDNADSYTSDKVVGALAGLRMLQDRLSQAVIDKNNLVKEAQGKQEVGTGTAPQG